MTVTASSGSTRVNPQLYDTLPLSSVRQAEQQDRFPDRGELQTLITFFQSGRIRVEAAQRLSDNAAAIVARAANRIFVGGTPLSYLEAPLGSTATADATPLAADQVAFQRSVQTFAGTTATKGKGNVISRLLEGAGGDADVRVVLPSGYNPISVGVYGTERMKKSIRDLAWFLRYVGYALVAGDPSILAVNTRGLRDVLEKACSLAATNVALQEMRAAAADLFKGEPEARSLDRVGGVVFDPVETPEEVLDLRLRDTHTLVGDADLDMRIGFRGGDSDPRSLRRVFDGVVDQVAHHLRDQVGIKPDREQRLIGCMQFDLLCLGGESVLLNHLI